VLLGPAGGADSPTVRDLLVVDADRAHESGRPPPDRSPLHRPRHRGSARLRSV